MTLDRRQFLGLAALAVVAPGWLAKQQFTLPVVNAAADYQVTFDQLLKDFYLPVVRAQLNQKSLLLGDS